MRIELFLTSIYIISNKLFFEKRLIFTDGNSKKCSEKTQNVKAKKDIFRPYCLKDPDIKPFKLPYEIKVSH